ncbi:MAG TPA: DUF6644 family protein [Bryobacteraceae bacterium]|jgi:hypothetical protein|nr:DUF6644 family protein [Bryobacteraceae bacterium]
MILHLFEWLGRTPVGVFMQQSTYAFAVVEMVHLLSLAILGGAILIVDLRVLGLGLKIQSVARLARELRPCLITSLLVSIVSGVLLLSEEPMKCYYNPAFRLKMLFLALAILFYFGIQQRLFQSEPQARAFLAKSAGFVSLLLWLAVGLAGRAIGII